jgi:hypothetical protein
MQYYPPMPLFSNGREQNQDSKQWSEIANRGLWSSTNVTLYSAWYGPHGYSMNVFSCNGQPTESVDLWGSVWPRSSNSDAQVALRIWWLWIGVFSTELHWSKRLLLFKFQFGVASAYLIRSSHYSKKKLRGGLKYIARAVYAPRIYNMHFSLNTHSEWGLARAAS